MADDISKDPAFKMLLEKQQQIELLMAQVQGDEDPARISALAEILAGEANELEAMGKAFQQAKGVNPDGALMPGTIEVVLTLEQRYRIYYKTGIDLETVRIPDERGILSKIMPQQKPQTIEVWALREAERRRALVTATVQAQAELDGAMAVIESSMAAVGTPEAELALAEAKAGMAK